MTFGISAIKFLAWSFFRHKSLVIGHLLIFLMAMGKLSQNGGRATWSDPVAFCVAIFLAEKGIYNTSLACIMSSI